MHIYRFDAGIGCEIGAFDSVNFTAASV